MQVHDLGTLPEVAAVGRSKHRTSAGRQHARFTLCQFIDDGLLEIPERFFTFAFEILANGAAQALFDDLVGICKPQAQPAPKLAADRGLAGARQANARNFDQV